MNRPRYTALVQGLPSTVPFVGPEAQERKLGVAFRARIGANESVFGPSPRAIAAMQEATPGLWMYGDPESHDLKRALAAYHHVSAENIVVGEGIDALLGYLVRLLVSEDVPVVTSLGAYPTFNYHVSGFGGRLSTVPYKNDAEDPFGLIELAQQEQANLIYLANPDNPMGTWHGADVVREMIDSVPDGSLLCLDEAYLEFAPLDTAPPLDVSDPRVIRFRTFSKAYGMAGARIGYGIGQADLIRAFDKVRNHFGVNRVAQIGAMTALEDVRYLDEVKNKVARGRERIAEIAKMNGLTALPSATNFVSVDCGGGGQFAEKVLQGLGAGGIFVRKPQVEPQNRCIRISVGTDTDLDLLEQELPRVIKNVE
jgi:histidinol-phosphate aminotransferase